MPPVSATPRNKDRNLSSDDEENSSRSGAGLKAKLKLKNGGSNSQTSSPRHPPETNRSGLSKNTYLKNKMLSNAVSQFAVSTSRAAPVMAVSNNGLSKSLNESVFQ